MPEETLRFGHDKSIFQDAEVQSVGHSVDCTTPFQRKSVNLRWSADMYCTCMGLSGSVVVSLLGCVVLCCVVLCERSSSSSSKQQAATRGAAGEEAGISFHRSGAVRLELIEGTRMGSYSTSAMGFAVTLLDRADDRVAWAFVPRCGSWQAAGRRRGGEHT